MLGSLAALAALAAIGDVSSKLSYLYYSELLATDSGLTLLCHEQCVSLLKKASVLKLPVY